MKHIILALAFFFSVGTLSAPSLAATIGENIPHGLSAYTHDIQKTDFHTLKGKNGLVVVFTRSADWCPYCQKQLIELNDIVPKLHDKGYNMVGISYDSVATLGKFHAQHDLQYPLLSDEGSEIIRAFGILNTDMQPGSKFYGIPNPTIYILDENGKIHSILANEGYISRPDPKDILDAIPKENHPLP